VKRRLLLLFPLGCVASIILAFLLWPREREPEYNGVPLNKWLERNVGWNDVEFTRAIMHMGTNALPMLVRSVDLQMPRWRVWLRCRVAPKLPKKAADSRLVQWLTGDLAIRRARGALNAFGILGRRADPALNDLRRIAHNDRMSFAGQAILRIIPDIPYFDEPPANLNGQPRAEAFPYPTQHVEVLPFSVNSNCMG
jgi:hypothetical protein